MKENLAQAIEGATQSLEVTRDIILACLDAKAAEVSARDVSHSVGISDYFVVASGKSDRQVQGIANKILNALEKNGISPVSVEGFELGQWVLIDCGDVVTHVFYEPMREHYDLDSLWHRAPKLDLTRDLHIDSGVQDRKVA
ncbi:MAG: ribosome silencing factor [Oligoflexia bacterium]|nr:ribosome silencing factor [Oligoflexia bacterium]